MLFILSLGGSMNDLYQALPDKILDWKAFGKDEIYNRETIFKYIDGGGELYLTYGFKQVHVRRYINPSQDEIILDIYDMGSSADAFGIFSVEREGEEAGFGQGSEYGGGLLRFWKGRYFVSIITMGDEEKSKPAIMELGKTVAALIEPGSKPSLLKLLPAEGLIENKISYLHSYIPLNNLYFIASDNILHLGPKTDCLWAEYRVSNDQIAYLLLIKYQDQEKAAEAYQNFIKIYMPEALPSGLAQMENKKWTAAKLNKNMVAVVFEALQKKWALKLLASLNLEKR